MFEILTEGRGEDEGGVIIEELVRCEVLVLVVVGEKERRGEDGGGVVRDELVGKDVLALEIVEEIELLVWLFSVGKGVVEVLVGDNILFVALFWVVSKDIEEF